MAVTYQNNSSTTEDGAVKSITISVPTGFSAGDLLIACVTKDEYNVEDLISLPAGWTAIQQGSDVANRVRLNVSYRIAEAGDTNWSWTWEENYEEAAGVILRYTGQAASGFIHNSDVDSGLGSQPTAPSVSHTSLNNGSLALQCFGTDDDDTPYTTPEQLTERYNLISGTGTSSCGCGGGDKGVSGTGNTGTGIFTMNASEQWAAVTVVIAAAESGVEYYDTVEIDIDGTPTKSADFDFKKTLSTSETSILTKSVGFQRTLDISGTMTPTELFKFLNTFSLSGTHSPILSSLFGVTKALSSSVTPTTLKVITFKQTPVVTEISALSILKKYFLEKTFSSSSTLDTNILYPILFSLTGTGTPTIIDTLGYHAIPSFQSTASLSTPLKFSLIKTLITEAVPTVTDIYTLASIISTTINNIPGITCKFKLNISDTGLGTPSVSSVLGKYDVVSFSIQGTPSLVKIMDYSPTITLNTTIESFIIALQTLFHEEASSGIGTPTVDMKDLLEVLFSETSSLTSSLKFSLLQSLSQTTTPTVDKIISFIKDIEMPSTSSLSIEDILEFILAIPLSTSQNITVEDIQTLIDLISTSTQGNLSISTKNILSILLQETSIFSSILKFFIVKVITSDISSTINITISYKDTISFIIENIPLITLLEELAKLVLALEDSQITDLILSDTQLKDLILSDTQLKDLTLEDL